MQRLTNFMSILGFECMTVIQITSHGSLCAIQPLITSRSSHHSNSVTARSIINRVLLSTLPLPVMYLGCTLCRLCYTAKGGNNHIKRLMYVHY